MRVHCRIPRNRSAQSSSSHFHGRSRRRRPGGVHRFDRSNDVGQPRCLCPGSRVHAKRRLRDFASRRGAIRGNPGGSLPQEENGRQHDDERQYRAQAARPEKATAIRLRLCEAHDVLLFDLPGHTQRTAGTGHPSKRDRSFLLRLADSLATAAEGSIRGRLRECIRSRRFRPGSQQAFELAEETVSLRTQLLK